MNLTEHEFARIRRYFSNALWVKHCADFYWLPHSRRVISILHDHRSSAAIPRAAVLIGTFRHPYQPASFMDDLDDLLSILDHQQQRAGT